jgi:hypothetical protein
MRYSPIWALVPIGRPRAVLLAVITAITATCCAAAPADALRLTHKRACGRTAEHAAKVLAAPGDLLEGVYWCRRDDRRTFRARVYSAQATGARNNDQWLTCFNDVLIAKRNRWPGEDAEKWRGLWWVWDPKDDGSCEWGLWLPHPGTIPGSHRRNL